MSGKNSIPRAVSPMPIYLDQCPISAFSPVALQRLHDISMEVILLKLVEGFTFGSYTDYVWYTYWKCCLLRAQLIFMLCSLDLLTSCLTHVQDSPIYLPQYVQVNRSRIIKTDPERRFGRSWTCRWFSPPGETFRSFVSTASSRARMALSHLDSWLCLPLAFSFIKSMSPG